MPRHRRDKSRGICSFCKAEILWVTTRTNFRKMPINPQLRRDGNIRLETIGRTRYAVIVKPGKGHYVSHFATCPNRKQYRSSSAAAPKPIITDVQGARPDDGPKQLKLEDLD